MGTEWHRGMASSLGRIYGTFVSIRREETARRETQRLKRKGNCVLEKGRPLEEGRLGEVLLREGYEGLEGRCWREVVRLGT